MTAARTVETVWRLEAPRLIAGLTRLVRDVGLAEELAQDALVSALETWPVSGVPDNPGAWLMTTAKNRGLDRLRREKLANAKHEALGHVTAQAELPDLEGALDETTGDDLLRLVFIACHPVLSTEARVALTLRLLGGLSTDEIARSRSPSSHRRSRFPNGCPSTWTRIADGLLRPRELDASPHRARPNETCRSGSCVPSAIDPSTCDPSSCTLPKSPLDAECGSSGTQAGAPYPGSAGCMARTGSSTEKGPSSATLRDDIITLNGKPTNAVVDRDNVAYVATDLGDLYAIELDSLKTRWHVVFATTPSNAAGSMLLADDGRLYIAGDTTIRGYSLSDGTQPRPEVDLGANVNSDIAVGENYLTATVSSGRLRSASVKTFTAGPESGNGAIQTGPTYFAGKIWVGNNGGELYSLAPATLTQTGGPFVPTGDRVTGIAGAPDGRLRLVLDDGNASFTIAAFDPSTNKPAWLAPIGPRPAVRFSVAHDGATWVDDDIFLTRIDSNGQASGTPIATTTLYPGLDVDGNVYVIESPAATLASYGPNTALRWRAAASVELSEIVVAKRGILLGLGTNGTLHVYR